MWSSLSLFDGDVGLVPGSKICIEEVISSFYHTNLQQIFTENHAFFNAVQTNFGSFWD